MLHPTRNKGNASIVGVEPTPPQAVRRFAEREISAGYPRSLKVMWRVTGPQVGPGSAVRLARVGPLRWGRTGHGRESASRTGRRLGGRHSPPAAFAGSVGNCCPGVIEDQGVPRGPFNPSDPRQDLRGAGLRRREGPTRRLRADRAGPTARRRPQRPRHPARRRRLRGRERLRGALPHADGRAAGGPRPVVLPVPHHRAVRPDPAGAADRAQPPRRRDGRDHRDRDVGTGLHLGAPAVDGPLGGGAPAQRVRDRAVREVPRGAGLADQPGRPVRGMAHRRRWLRALLRLPGRRDQPVRACALQRHDPDRADLDRRRGLPLHRGHDRPRDRVAAAALRADSRQALLHVLRTGRDARTAPRAVRVGRQVPRPVRRRLGCPARADLRGAEAPRRRARRRRAHRTA